MSSLVAPKSYILIIDDSEDTLDVLTLFFSLKGFSIRVATNRDLGLGIIKTFGMPDAIITDFRMIGMELDDFVAAVRSESPRIPIFVISADVAAVAAVAERLGLESFSKPFEIVVLLEALERSLANRFKNESQEEKSGSSGGSQ